MKIQEDATAVNIPKKAFVLFYEILESMAEGKTVTLLPTIALSSTNQSVLKQKRSKHLALLPKQAQELNLGY
jgi:hypothetical protein